MIALAITCLLVVAAFVAVLSAADSLLRGWRSYGALARELRALRTAADTRSAASRAMARRPALRAPHRAGAMSHRSATRFRAAA